MCLLCLLAETAINKQEKNCRTTSESKGRFFFTKRIDSLKMNRWIDSNSKSECSTFQSIIYTTQYINHVSTLRCKLVCPISPWCVMLHQWMTSLMTRERQQLCGLELPAAIMSCITWLRRPLLNTSSFTTRHPLSLSLTHISLHFNNHFPGEPGLASFTEVKGKLTSVGKWL